MAEIPEPNKPEVEARVTNLEELKEIATYMEANRRLIRKDSKWITGVGWYVTVVMLFNIATLWFK